MNFIDFVFIFSTFIILWEFAGYPLLMFIISTNQEVDNGGNNFTPTVSIIVPTYNEEKVIKQKIINLLELDYNKNKYEIIIIDSGSDDKTRSIVNDMIKILNNIPKITLVEQILRKGKPSALKIGVESSNFDIVMISDANSVYQKDVLKLLASKFCDPIVGGVGGRYIVSNDEIPIVQSESIYWKIENIMFTGESILDSVCTVMGSISAWRREFIEINEKAISDDFEMTIRMRRSGHRVKYISTAISLEKAATNKKDQIKQKKRIAIGTIQTLINHLDYVVIPKDYYSAIILPSHKWLQILSPFFILCWIIFFLILTGLNGIILISLLIIFIFVFNILEKYLINNKIKSISHIIFAINYFILNEFIIILAWISYLRGVKSVLWEKADSTR